MASSFNTSTPLAGGASYPNTTVWDNVLNNKKFFAQIITDQQCKMTVYESNNSLPLLINSVVYEFNYDSLNKCVIIEGSTNCQYISFLLQNTSNTLQSFLYFSVIYK